MCLSGDVKTSSKLRKGETRGKVPSKSLLWKMRKHIERICRKLLRKLERIKGSQSR